MPGIDEHEATAAAAHAAVAEADGKALEEAQPLSSIQEEFRDNKLGIGDHEATAAAAHAAVAEDDGRASEEA